MRVVEVGLSGVLLSLYAGFVKVSRGDEELNRIPLDNIDSLIVTGFGIRYSHNLLCELSHRNIPLVLCGKNFVPSGFLIPGTTHYEMQARIQEQISVSLPLRKGMWKTVVQQKVRNQARNLQDMGDDARDLLLLWKKVRSGDPDNIEAQAARKYWQRLFGSQFRRDFEQPGINAALNFGYAILRGCVIRNICGAGLIPAIGIHHQNRLNPFCLADDLMEPYRPYIDVVVKENGMDGELNPQSKKILVAAMDQRREMDGKQQTLQSCVRLTVLSLVESFKQKKNLLQYPK